MKKFLFLCLPLVFLASCSETPTPVSQNTAYSGVILAMGDSLTIGYGLPESESYPAQLERLLQEAGYRYRIENAGVSGDTSAGLLARTDWMLDGNAPQLVILCIGANDAFQ